MYENESIENNKNNEYESSGYEYEYHDDKVIDNNNNNYYNNYNVIIDVVNNICDIILVFLLIILILGGTAIIATEKGIESMMVDTQILWIDLEWSCMIINEC